MREFDAKDHALLNLLTLEPRIPWKRAARRLRLSENGVAYRVARLQERGVIRKFTAIIDHDRIGVSAADIYLKLRLRKGEESRVYNFFRTHPRIIWSMKLFGEWDVMATFFYREISEMYQVCDEIGALLGDMLLDYSIKFSDRRHKIELVYGEPGRVKPKLWTAPREIVALDALDTKILSILNLNGRASYKEIGDTVGCSLETARNRVLRLVDKGVIQRFNTTLKWEKLGYQPYLVLIEMQNLDAETWRKIVAYLYSKPEIKLAVRTVGIFEAYLLTFAKNVEEVEALANEMRGLFFDTIKRVYINVMVDELKIDYFPEWLAGASPD